MSDLPSELQAALGGAYIIQRELGGGGMSRVFHARETALNREVVIKVIAPELLEGVSAERFAREVQLAARLQQANIVPVLSAGDAAGTSYYVMPFVRGESLRAWLARGETMPVAQAVSILRDVARALEYAHGEGVVHRDIKPDNILLSGSTAVVADFGIAKAVSVSRTMEGMGNTSTGLTVMGSAVGTPAYMAPEQAAGDGDTDARADLYAWGVVAWELLAGRHPFAAKTTPRAMLAAHMAEVPLPLATVRSDVPLALATLVTRCLEKDPALRPPSAHEVLHALDAVVTPSAMPLSTSQDGHASGSGTPAARARRSWLSIAAPALLVAIAFGAWFGMRYRNDATGVAEPGSGGTVSGSALMSIAVLPFVNTSGNAQDEYFSDGMTDELAHALSKLPGLKLAGRSSSFSFKGKTASAPEIGKTLGVGAIIEGTVRRSGDRLRVTSQLTSTRDGGVLWSDSFERSGTDVFAVQDAFTTAITGALRPLLGRQAPSATLAATEARGTTDAVAYDLYLRGRFLWAKRGPLELDSAVLLFTQAVSRDPGFARGWSGLAQAHVLHSNFNVQVAWLPAFAAAAAAARKAIALDSTLADPHTAIAFGRMRQFDLEMAKREFAIAQRLEPRNATVHHWSAYLSVLVGDTAQALRSVNTALGLDPLSATQVNTLGAIFSELRRWPEALATYARVRALAPDFNRIGPAIAFIFTGQPDSAIAAVRATNPLARGVRGTEILALAAAGRWDEARRARATLAPSRDRSDFNWNSAIAAVAFAEPLEATRYFIESFEKDGVIANLANSMCHPVLQTVQDQPAFIAWRTKHGLPRCDLHTPWPIKSPPPGRQQ